MHETQMENELRDFLSTHSSEDLIAVKHDLDNRLRFAKEKTALNAGALEEIRSERTEIKADIERMNRELTQITTQSKEMRAKIEQLEENQAADNEAIRKQTDENKHAGMSSEQINALRDKLTQQRTTVSQLEEEVEELDNKKPKIQAAVVEMRTLLKEKKEILVVVRKERDEAVERQEYRVGQCEALVKAVEDLHADINRVYEKLKAPATPVNDPGQTLFNEVLAEKKLIEQEVTSVMEFTSSLRQRISQMRDEIEELQSHEHEGLSDVDIDHMLGKMNAFVKDAQAICEAVSKVQTDLMETIAQIEQLVEMKTASDRDNFVVVKEYDLNCMRLVIHECHEVQRKIRARFFDLEQLAAEATQLEEAARHR